MILVCGGAGYIGSHAVYRLIEKGERVAVVDNLQTGHRKAVHPEAIFYEGDIRDRHFLSNVFKSMKSIQLFILQPTLLLVKV